MLQDTFIRSEIDSTDFKNENLASKIKKSKKSKKTPYQKTVKIDDILDQDAQIEVKKLSEKYPQKFKLPGETGKVFNTDINRLKASKKIKEKYKKIRQNKVKSRKIIESNKVNKILKDIDTVEEIKDISNKKRKQAAARAIIKKYKTIKKPKKTYLVEDIKEVAQQQQDVKGESIIEAVNNVFDFRKFKKDQEKMLKKGKTSRKITAEKISKKYKNLKKPKKTYLVNKEDLETEMYNETQQDLFEGESVLAAANKVFDFKKFQQDQRQRLENYKEKHLNDAKTINYADDLNLDDVLEKKNLKIAAKQISDKYRKLRKRKAAISVPKLHKISKSIVKPDKKGKKNHR